MLISINPSTGETLAEYAEFSQETALECVEKAHAVFLEWRKSDGAERAKKMKKAGEILRERKAEFARLMSLEMGKPFAQGLAEVEKCAWLCDFYAERSAEFLAPEYIATDASKSFVSFKPLGVILAVMPWNFPFWQVFRFLVPALMAGNTGLLKHSSNVSACSLAIEDVVRNAGFPDGAFRSLLLSSSGVPPLIEHPFVQGVTLTGSTPAGQSVAALAGKNLKKTVMELGGSDPYLILADADLERAAESCAIARCINSGQSCIAAKRFIVEEAVLEKFERLFTEAMRRKIMGNPLDDGVEIGPQAREDLRDELHQQVRRSVELGARILCGGAIPDAAGAFYPPTVLTNVRKGMPAYHEELFGPVAAIISARDEAEAIRIANDTPFGLGAAVFTQDAQRGERIANEELEAGSCFVNTFVHSDPRLPFGGIKESGFGRELSAFGIREFVNVKTVFVQ